MVTTEKKKSFPEGDKNAFSPPLKKFWRGHHGHNKKGEMESSDANQELIGVAKTRTAQRQLSEGDRRGQGGEEAVGRHTFPKNSAKEGPNPHQHRRKNQSLIRKQKNLKCSGLSQKEKGFPGDRPCP